jgi:nucleolar protein 14
VRVSSGLPSFVELHAPTLKLLRTAHQLPSALVPVHDACTAAVDTAVRAAVDARTPLRMVRAPAVPIRQFNPAFDDDFQPGISSDPDRERLERQKLKRKTKKEHKGAVRELRKDSAFLANERDRDRQKRDSYLEARGKRALTLLETQEHSVKEMKREKRKLTR